MDKILIIGISGTTNCGKSSLVRKLLKCFPGSKAMCQDHYFLKPDDERVKLNWIPEVNHGNWEIFEALEMDIMMDHLKKWKLNAKPPDILFIDGFLMYTYEPLLDLFDRKYFMKIPHDVCKERRNTRNYDPPDVPGYFDKVVWPMAQQHISDISKRNDIVYLDGTDEQSKLLELVCEDLKMAYPALKDIYQNENS